MWLIWARWSSCSRNGLLCTRRDGGVMADGERTRERRERRREQRGRPRQPSVAPGGLETQAYKPLADGDIRRIHEASLTVLERTGVQIEPSEAREMLLDAWARLDGERVLIPRATVAEAL